MQRVIIDEPYQFIPPSYSEWWPSIIQLYLKRVPFLVDHRQVSIAVTIQIATVQGKCSITSLNDPHRWEDTSTQAEQHRDIVTGRIRHRQVGMAVSVQITDGDG